MTNREVLDDLWQKGAIALRRGALFATAPGPMPKSVVWDRIEGMMLGLAIGDALGARTEYRWTPQQRRNAFGEIRDYLDVNGQPALGLPSDDTQLAFWTLEQMNADKGFIPENVAQRLCKDQIFGIGIAMAEFVMAYRSGTQPCFACAPSSAGNGALMRIAPMLIPHLKTGTSDLWVDTALSAQITHNDPLSTSACLSLVNILWQLLQMKAPPDPCWWADTYVRTARDLEGNTEYKSRDGSPLGREGGYSGSMWQFVAETVRPQVPGAYGQGRSVFDVCNYWYSSGYLFETVPSVLYILSQHADNPEEAIVRAVTDTKDNDSIGAIVGAAVGALHGKKKLPACWLDKTRLPGRTTQDDDGKIYTILDQARATWWS